MPKVAKQKTRETRERVRDGVPQVRVGAPLKAAQYERSPGGKYANLVATLKRAKAGVPYPVDIPKGADPDAYRLTIYTALYRLLGRPFRVLVLKGRKQLGVMVVARDRGSKKRK